MYIKINRKNWIYYAGYRISSRIFGQTKYCNWYQAVALSQSYHNAPPTQLKHSKYDLKWCHRQFVLFSISCLLNNRLYSDILKRILYVQEVLTISYSKILHKMGRDLLDCTVTIQGCGSGLFVIRYGSDQITVKSGWKCRSYCVSRR